MEILLVTSRDTGRWVVPKGNPIAGLEGHETAAQEALEEAGVEGEAGAGELGRFEYQKKRRIRPDVTAEVSLYSLRVERLLDDWSEAHQRQRRWFAQTEAAEAVVEEALKRLILAFRP